VITWSPKLDWGSPPGKLIDQLLVILPSDKQITITVFGTAPLQMAYKNAAVSLDVDAFANEDIEAIVHEHGLDGPNYQPKIHLCADSSFQAGPNWQDRAYVISRNGHVVRFPHPYDILISKLHRFGERDKQAFQFVIEQTGHPTEQELLEELKRAVDLYRPSFDEERQSRIWHNTLVAWRFFFHREIDVRNEIVQPALERRKSDYHQTRSGLKDILKKGSADKTPPN
jgi:hypothetical protein